MTEQKNSTDESCDEIFGELDVADAISPYDAEAEPEDLEAMELNLSQHSEDFSPEEPGPGARDEDEKKLTAEEQDELCEGPQEPEWASADMPLEQYDPDMAKSIQDEMEELALAEPEPPEEDEDNGQH